MSLQSSERSPLVGAPIVRDVLRAVIVTAAAVAVVWAATSTSRRLCTPIPDSWWVGAIPPNAPQEFCATIHLEPSPIVFAVLALVLVLSIARVLRTARTADEGGRILSRAVTVIVVVVGATVAVSQAWLWLYGYPGSLPSGELFVVSPFPFAGGSVEDDTLGFAVLG
ncbi:hypothetical protein [Microbacterium oleivorans]|uniref:hypothetical protein n=1 Tax=Microbacterium oleivorans TaxID=273677 RepID=UPI00080EA7FF|nr:hypothetical protein [Microbacterium oleivorans]